ncbi:MAG: hypothetical protein HPY62_11960 [Bacteroidales bacterium]|nr:hypothetical protein [Bacteroidales bacterium]
MNLKLTAILLLMTNIAVCPQNAPGKSDGKEMPADSSSKVSDHSLFAGAGYGSNMIYLGSTITGDQPYGYAALSYGYKNKLYTTISAVHLSDFNPKVAFYIGSLNYSHVFNSWLDISAGLYGYHVAPSLTDTLFSDFLYGDLTLGFDWKLLYTKLSAGALMSTENQVYLQARNSRYFRTPGFSRKNLFFSFDPYVNLLFGTLISTETTTETTVTVSQPFRKWRKTSTSQSTTNTVVKKSFGLIEADFGLPVALNGNSFTIEAEPGYVLSVHDDPYYPGIKGFIFMLSGFFKIF